MEFGHAGREHIAASFRKVPIDIDIDFFDLAHPPFVYGASLALLWYGTSRRSVT
jgi:hypothetical protein